jgi:hypothetical protein
LLIFIEPPTGIEPVFLPYQGSVLPLKLWRQVSFNK